MNAQLKNILEYNSSKNEVDKTKINEVVLKELAKFNFENDYLKEGSLKIENASEIIFYSCVVENYTDNRSMSEEDCPNRSGVAQGNKRFSEFNVWNYELEFQKEFQNCVDNHDILESHHAIGCQTCKQHGKIKCSNCTGAGDVTCGSCSGRGEKQCSSCSGRGETKCWSCSGKGTKETGYGDNKRIERCSSCSGKGYKPCNSCRNGYVTCSSCSGKGRVTCYTCQGSGKVTCYECEGYRTMDHYFVVTSDFINLSQTLFLSNPYPGFDQNKSKVNDFNIQQKLFDIKEDKFRDGYFEEINASPFFRQITAFFAFIDNETSKLLASRLSVFENKYFEVLFTFYDEKYTIFFDRTLEHSYYNGKKPSDEYELDLLKKAIETSVNNELSITKKTIQKLSNYDFISISEKEIISAIEDSESIYNAYDGYVNKKYSYAEKTLRLVSKLKKSEDDFLKLRKKLNRLYLLNTLIFSAIGSLFIFYVLLDKGNHFLELHYGILINIIFFSLLLNRVTKNIHFSRFFVLALLGIQFISIKYFEKQEGDKISSENVLQEQFKTYKNEHYFVANGVDSIILIEATGVEKKRYYLPKGKGFSINWGGQSTTEKYAKERIYLGIDEEGFKQAAGNYKVTVTVNQGGLDIEVNYDDILFEDDENMVEVKYMRNNIDDYKMNIISTIFLSKVVFNKIKSGLKNIADKNITSTSSKDHDKQNSVFKIASKTEGGIIIQIDESGQHGLVMSTEDLGSFNWADAKTACEKLVIDGYRDWRLPSKDELNKMCNLEITSVGGFANGSYWSSTEYGNNEAWVQALKNFGGGYRNGVGDKDDAFYVRAVREF